MHLQSFDSVEIHVVIPPGRVQVRITLHYHPASLNDDNQLRSRNVLSPYQHVLQFSVHI